MADISHLPINEQIDFLKDAESLLSAALQMRHKLASRRIAVEPHKYDELVVAIHLAGGEDCSLSEYVLGKRRDAMRKGLIKLEQKKREKDALYQQCESLLETVKKVQQEVKDLPEAHLTKKRKESPVDPDSLKNLADTVVNAYKKIKEVGDQVPKHAVHVKSSYSRCRKSFLDQGLDE